MKARNIKIRNATEADLPGMSAVSFYAEAIAAQNRGVLAGNIIKRDSLPRHASRMSVYFNHFADLRSEDPLVSFRVAEHKGEILGYATTRTPEDKIYFANSGLLDGLYVDPGYWRHGVGRLLLKDGENRLRNSSLEKAIARVIKTDDNARAFYKHMGWTERSGNAHPTIRQPDIVMYELKL